MYQQILLTPRHGRRFAALLASALASPVSFATVCDDPGDASYVAGEFVSHGTSLLDRESATTDQDNQNLRLVAQGPGGFVTGFSHRYTRFNFENIALQTNAHVHTSALPVHWRNAGRTLRAALAPTLSASSNVLGHPQKYRGDSVQLAFALMWQRRLAHDLRLNYGLCGDHRFGRHQVYPSVVVEWQPAPRWQVEFGFPRTRITWRFHPALQVGFMAEPDGSEWHVMDRAFEQESQLHYEAYAAEAFLRWAATPHLSVAVTAGRQVGSRFEMTLRSGERVALEGDDVRRLGAEIRWRF